MSRDITKIVVHTADASHKRKDGVIIPVYQSAKIIHDYHVLHNGWRKGGYHAIVLFDGTVDRDSRYTRGDDEEGAHVGGLNANTLGVCVTGDGDVEDFTAGQKRGLVTLCADWCERYRFGSAHVIGHRETPEHGGPPVGKTCPGTKVDMNQIRGLVEQELVKRATKKVLGSPSPLELRVAALEEQVRKLEARTVGLQQIGGIGVQQWPFTAEQLGIVQGLR